MDLRTATGLFTPGPDKANQGLNWMPRGPSGSPGIRGDGPWRAGGLKPPLGLFKSWPLRPFPFCALPGLFGASPGPVATTEGRNWPGQLPRDPGDEPRDIGGTDPHLGLLR